MRLIRIKELPHEYPVKISTLYAWHHYNKYPGLFAKVGGLLCVDMDKIDGIVTIKKPNDKSV